MKARKVYESLGNILKPKSEEEIGKSMEDTYGFIPSEESRIMTQRGNYPIEYHVHLDENDEYTSLDFYKRDPNKKYSTLQKLKGAERRWLIDLLKARRLPYASYDTGIGWDRAKDLIKYFESL